MAYGGGDYLDITLPAAADLSTYQYRFITIDANGRGTVATATTDAVVGILQNKPSAANVPARVRVHGISKHVAGAAQNEGAYLSPGVEGCGTATTQAGAIVGAMVLTASGGSGDLNDVLLMRFIY